MSRIAGVNIPEQKHAEIALTAIYGLGRRRARQVCQDASVPFHKKVGDMDAQELASIRNAIASRGYLIEGDLRRETSLNIKRLRDLGCYRGIRHRLGLPVRGQHTKTNARTRKGPRRAVKKR